MDFEYTPEQQAFRVKVRTWIEENLPQELCVDDPRDERIAPDYETFVKRRAWQRTMYEVGWVGIAWPKEYERGLFRRRACAKEPSCRAQK